MQHVPYTYLIGWTNLNKWYYGIRYKDGCNPDELWKVYFTSSKLVKQLRISHGEPDIIEIRKTFSDKIKANIYEAKVLRRLKVIKKDKWLNQHYNGVIIIKDNNVRKKKNEIQSVSIKGRIHINNGIIGKFIRKNDDIPEGYVLGRLPKTLEKTAKKKRGMILISNGISSHYISANEPIPQGYRYGTHDSHKLNQKLAALSSWEDEHKKKIRIDKRRRK
jgi:hypothetical protein